jgi:hypothetical protein
VLQQTSHNLAAAPRLTGLAKDVRKAAAQGRGAPRLKLRPQQRRVTVSGADPDNSTVSIEVFPKLLRLLDVSCSLAKRSLGVPHAAGRAKGAWRAVVRGMPETAFSAPRRVAVATLQHKATQCCNCLLVTFLAIDGDLRIS